MSYLNLLMLLLIIYIVILLYVSAPWRKPSTIYIATDDAMHMFLTINIITTVVLMVIGYYFFGGR